MITEVSITISILVQLYNSPTVERHWCALTIFLLRVRACQVDAMRDNDRCARVPLKRRIIMQSVAEIEASPEVQDLRNRVSGFLNELIYPNEKILEKGDAESSRTLKAIQAEAKKRGLWALGLPKDIGGGGLGFMPYVFVNEIVGRSEYAIVALGTHSAQDATMLNLYAHPDQRKRWLPPLVNGGKYPGVSMPRA